MQVAAPEEVTSGKYAGVVEPASRTELAILEQQVDVSSDYSAIVEKGKLALNGELPTVILADVCHFLAKHRHWDFFTDNALDIIERLQTAPAVDMVVSACYETGKHQDVLTILDKHKSSFPNSQLPPSLKRLKLLAQRSQGMLPDALHEARILARQTGLLEDYMMVANLCLEKGDVDSVQRVVAEVRAKQGLPPEGALHFSRVLAPHEPEFAKELFQDAVSSGLNPKNISEAYFLAQQIGILEQYESLAASFIAQVQDGSTVNVKAITSIEEIKEVVAEQQRGAAERERLYAKGRGALHFLLGGVNSTMAFCFHQLRKHAAQIDDLISTPSLLIRHGGRPILDQFPESLDGIHLYMDITALVLSHHLGILSDVEKCFGTIHIPHEIPLALLQMESDTASVQHDVAELNKSFLSLVESGRGQIQDLQDFSALDCSTAKTHFLLSLDAEFPDEANDSLRINCRLLADALLNGGELSVSLHEQAVKLLGKEGRESEWQRNIELGDSVYCLAGAVSMLGHSGLLEVAVQNFDLIFSLQEVELIKQQVEEAEQRAKLKEWIAELRTVVSRGIDAGTYIQMPVPEKMILDRHEDRTSYDESSLASLLVSNYSDGAIVWIDDRFINSYQSMNEATTFSVVDVLQMLLFYGSIDELRFYDLLLILRNENCRFIPLLGEEVCFHLKDSLVNESKLIETHGLRCLRQYFAACFYSNSELQDTNQPEGVANPFGELHYLVQYHRGIERALIGVWGEVDSTYEEKVIRSNWIVDNLFVENFPFLPEWADSEDKEVHFLSIFYSGLIAQAIGLCTISESVDNGQCVAYLDWLYANLLSPRFDANPGLLDAVGRFVGELAFKDHPLPLESREEREEYEIIKDKISSTALLLQWQLLKALPEPLRGIVHDQELVKAKFDQIRDRIVLIGENQFRISDIKLAVNQAAVGKKSKVKVVNSDEEYVVDKDPETNEGLTLRFSNEDDGGFIVSSPANCVLLSSVKDRLDCLKHHYFELDLSPDLANTVLPDIVNVEDEHERVVSIIDVLNDSCVSKYEGLRSLIEKEKVIRINMLAPPSGAALIKFLRINADSKAPIDFDGVAQNMLAELGPVETLWRFAGLPCPFPRATISYLEALRSDERLQIIEDFGRRVSSYLSGFHYVHLASLFEIKSESSLAKIVNGWLSQEYFELSIEMHLNLYRWTLAIVNSLGEMEKVHPSLRMAIAWSHSSQLMAILMADGMLGEGFADAIRQQSTGLGLPDHMLSAQTGFDVADAFVLTDKGYIAAALSYALEHFSQDSSTEELVSWVDKRYQFVDGDSSAPVTSVLRDVSLARNDLGSFLGTSFDVVFERLGHEKLAAQCGTEHISKLVADLLRDFYGPSLDGKWAVLAAAMPYGNVYPEIYPDLKRWALSIDFASVSSDRNKFGFTCLAYLAGVAGVAKDEELSAFVWGQLCAVVTSRQDKGEKYGVAAWDETGAVLEVAWKTALVEPDLASFAKKFASLVTEVVTIDKRLAHVARRIVVRVCECLPVTAAKELSDTLFLLRACQ